MTDRQLAIGSFLVAVIALCVSLETCRHSRVQAEAAMRSVELHAKELSTTLRVHAFLETRGKVQGLHMKIVNEGAPIEVESLGFALHADKATQAGILYWKPKKIDQLGLPRTLERNGALDLVILPDDLESMSTDTRWAVTAVVASTSNGRWFFSEGASSQLCIDFVKSK